MNPVQTVARPGAAPTRLQGQIERITFANPENGYTIARLAVPGERELATVVGSLPDVSTGEVLDMEGEWTRHPQYGAQFKIARYTSVMPATEIGIEKYLGSGLIKGIGPRFAKRLVKVFGEKTLDIIEHEPQKLKAVQGLGAGRIKMILAAWKDQRQVRDVMVFLQGHGVSAAYAAKIFKQYGAQSVAVVREDPYRLAQDIHGVGFITADKIARQLGVEKESPSRCQAGILFVLQQLSEEGHVYYPYEGLIKKAGEILQVERDILVQAFSILFEEGKVAVDEMAGADPSVPNLKAVYLKPFHTAETQIARKMQALLHTPSALRGVDPAKALAWVESELKMNLAERQREAVKASLEKKVLVVTGGPGTGKTTLVRAIIGLFRKMTPRIVLGAPTGRAAKRLSESTGLEAKTLHRLLEWDYKKMGFKRDAGNPLAADLVVLDEVSMVDNLLMFHFLKALPAEASLILVGDADQLPSVGPGSVFKDIIASGVVPVVRLEHIFRQAQGSLIITNAHRINQGQYPVTPDLASGQGDFFFAEAEEAEEAGRRAVDLVAREIPRRFGFHPLRDIQIISPMHRGPVGAAELNLSLQAALNPEKRSLILGGRSYKKGDKVMQTRNNYDKDVYNGDIGLIELIDYENQAVGVRFDDRVVEYEYQQMDELMLAYAISIHKSQGSEYPAVVIPLHTSHFILLQRNLLYTAVTRGKKLVVIVGNKKALAIAVKNDKPDNRFTGLRERLAHF